MESVIIGNGFTKDEFEDVQTCLETLLGITAGEQPLDRDLGIDITDIVDAPAGLVNNFLSLEITEKINEYEPRVKVDDVRCSADENGVINATVYVSKRSS